MKTYRTKRDGSQRPTLAAPLLLLLSVFLLGAVLPSNNKIAVQVGNDSGTRFDYLGTDTYYINFKTATSGLNALHIATQSDDLVGTDYLTFAPTGAFFVTSSDSKGYYDEIVLLVSVNTAAFPADFSLHLTAAGYQVAVDASEVVILSNYVNPSLSEQFGPADFIYGHQTWKPSGSANYPLWVGEDPLNPANFCLLMFVDLYVGSNTQSALWPGLIDGGSVRVDYRFENLPGLASFNAYGYRTLTSGDIEWGNRTSGAGSSGWRIQPIGDLLGNVYDAYTPPRKSVDGDDLIWMALHYGTKLGDADWVARIDIVGNGIIDDADVAALMAQFGLTY